MNQERGPPMTRNTAEQTETAEKSTTVSDGDQYLGQFIPPHYHYQMLLDESRMQGFEEAIQRAVPPQGLVVELGAGTGVLSSFAARNARKVWSIERNPQMAEIATRFINENGLSDRVEIIRADAKDYCPPEPVDVVICEMLHSGLLREKQLQVIGAFKKNYHTRFPDKPLPTLIPEATILACQPVHQNFTFHGYRAPIPMFFEPHNPETGTSSLTDPLVYSFFEYRGNLPTDLSFQTSIKIATTGELNAVRFVTKNVLHVNLQENRTVDWHNFYMVLPIHAPIPVTVGDRVSIRFSYQPGDPIESLTSSLNVQKEIGAP